MEAPLISVITPSFNQARFLREALDSVLTQDYPAVESIVVDGGSTDGSLEILRSYGDRVRWVSEPDRGQGHALNKGFAMARGTVLGWINSDDRTLPGAARRAAEAFAEDETLGFVYGRGWIIDEQGSRVQRFPYTEPFNLWRLIHFGDTILQQSAFLRKSAVEAVGGVDEALSWGLDWDLFIRLGLRFPARMIDADMGEIRVHGAAKTSTGGFKRLRELGAVVEKHAGTRWTASFAGFALGAAYGWASRAAEHMPAAAGKQVRRAVDLAHDFAARRVLPAMEECQGWLADGWALERLHVLFPAALGGGEAILRGSAPAGGQNLTILWNGDRQSVHSLHEGPFELRVSAPPSADRALHLELRAERMAGRRRRFHGGDQKLCYRLDSVAMRLGGREYVSLPPPQLIAAPGVGEQLG